MSWNYRVVKHINVPDVYYGVHEVYYSRSDHCDSMTVDSVGIVGRDLDDLCESLGMFIRAFTKPVLVYDHKEEKFVEEDA